MPETTDNDAPGADRPTARAGQEGPSKTGDAPAARPPSEAEAERAAREAAQQAKKGAREGETPESGSPTDMAP